MSRLNRVGAAVRRGVALLVPAGRRDWVEAVWAEAPEVPPGLRRLAWRAGGVRLIAREALMRRGIGSALLFAVAAALAGWAAWTGSPASFAASVDRVDVITMVVLLGGLGLAARWVFGPPGHSRVARLLRAGTYAAILALIPAKNVVEQVLSVPPRGGIDLRLYRLISGPGFGNHWENEILFLVVMALYAAAILWLTSQRSRVAPATLAIGMAAGTALGAAWYVIGPLGFGGAPATNPWLPGSDIAPFLVLAALLLVGAPVAAMVAAGRRSTAPGSMAPRAGPRIRQIAAASLLTGLAGALLVTVSGTVTIAAMLTAPWLRNWLYHGHPLSGVAGLQPLLRGNPAALAYSHQITAAADAPPYLIICIVFPLVALVLSGLGALGLAIAATGQGDPPRGGGGPPGPEPAPDPPTDASWPAATDDDAELPGRGVGQRLGDGVRPRAGQLHIGRPVVLELFHRRQSLLLGVGERGHVGRVAGGERDECIDVHAEDVTGMVTTDARGEEGAVVAAVHAVTAVTEAGHQLGERARDAAVVPSGFGDRAGESVAR